MYKRQALAGIARENADVPSSGLYTAAKGLVPEGLTVDLSLIHI